MKCIFLPISTLLFFGPKLSKRFKNQRGLTMGKKHMEKIISFDLEISYSSLRPQNRREYLGQGVPQT